MSLIMTSVCCSAVGWEDFREADGKLALRQKFNIIG